MFTAKKIYKVFILSGALALSPWSKAELSSNGGMGVLKTNVENSEHNLKQYQTNAQISQENIREISRAIIDLDKTERQLMDNHANLEKNKAALNSIKEQVQGFKTEEIEKMKAEEAQLQELLAMVKKLEANQQLRQKNLAAYDQKMIQIDQEVLDWDNQNRSMSQLKKQIAEKRSQAVQERGSWQTKRDSYLAETKKWEQELESSRKTLSEYQHLVSN